jgi:hypothetical protein
MQMHCLPEAIVCRALASAKIPAKIVDVRFTNTAARDFDGKLVYFDQPPVSFYVGKQYCVAAPKIPGHVKRRGVSHISVGRYGTSLGRPQSLE